MVYRSGQRSSRVLMFFHGGGYCSGSIVSHRRLVTEAGRAAGVRTLAIAYRLAPEHPFPCSARRCTDGMAFSAGPEVFLLPTSLIGGDSAGAGLHISVDRPAARCTGEAAGLRLVNLVAMDGFDDVGPGTFKQGCRRSAHSQGVSVLNWPTLICQREWIGRTRVFLLFTRISRAFLQ